ncbi:[FeFe] hydrogenase, group A [Patescibacteria group bacterium]|nr:[FeFe] hydrogenase, group A [Patescibacteria group bacterium]MBU1683532.1 [FeFe] hydrogenase, group A [Patescibacteria group bacterium]MBU1935016.1 [FeFe] hydrogenase, group A [Patescibacteria group bacterium]
MPDNIHKMAVSVELDYDKCIGCTMCVRRCQEIGVNYLKMNEDADKKHADFVPDPDVDCIYCGQCTLKCPVDAIREQSQIEELEKALNKEGEYADKILIAQMAPSIRSSIGEMFGQEPGTILTEQMFTALRKLGFDKIFDINMGADITTYTEALELAERIKEGGVMPMFTSCCPAWVKYAEFYHPEILPHLTTARSPHIHSGGAYKTYWADREGIDPTKIVVVSFVPCTAKKYEATLEKFNVRGLPPVDIVLTTRELGRLLKKKEINPVELEPGEVDTYGQYSGAAAIYGASGGVMESALRSAHFFLTGEELEMDRIKFEDVRGMDGIKRAEVEVGGKKLHVAVASQVNNAQVLIDEVKENKSKYDYIEVMSCPGGCVGGGGQPIPSSPKIVDERRKALYTLDDNLEVRKAHKNPVVADMFDNYLANLPDEERSAIIHTSFRKRDKGE